MFGPDETTVFMTSNEPWSEVWFSKQHYANELARLGYEVYFLNAPRYWSPRHWFSGRLDLRRVQPGLSVVEYDNPYPLRLMPARMLAMNDAANSRKLLPLAKRPYTLWWKFDPFRFVQAPAFDRRTTRHIYHVTDPFEHIFSDALLARQADLVVTVLERDLERYAGYARNAPLYVPHGISGAEFELEAALLAEYEDYKDSILMVGTLNEDYSIALLEAVALAFPERQLVLVGPDRLKTDASRAALAGLCSLPNVRFLGAQPATRLKYYIQASAVCIVPYRFGIEHQKGTPLKVLNYLAQNKPSVTSISTGLQAYLGKGVWYAGDQAAFLDELHAALQGERRVHSPEVRAELDRLLYPNLIQTILSRLLQST